ncbi:MAG: hypothetical protein ACR2PL_08245 [Dehalococcoidia bacterium]
MTTIKEELHEFIDRLDDERASVVATHLRRLLDEAGVLDNLPPIARSESSSATTISGHGFFSQKPVNLKALAAQQGVQPVANFNNLLGNFWPEDETADEFIATVRRWRHEGGLA